MVLFIKYLDEPPISYVINNTEDLYQTMDMIGIPIGIVLGHQNTLHSKVHQLVTHLNKHHLTAWYIDKSDMDRALQSCGIRVSNDKESTNIESGGSKELTSESRLEQLRNRIHELKARLHELQNYFNKERKQ